MLEGYKRWVRRNAGLLSLFETGLSSVTWLLPERFSEGELTIEALHTALGLLSGFHDSIVSVPPGAPPPPGTDLALALSTLEQIQVLLELVATRREEQGGSSRYTSLAVLESIKALVRLVAWRRSGSRLLLHGGLGNLEQVSTAAGGAAGEAGSHVVAQGRPQEVFGAFAAFRQRRCQLPQQEQGQGEGKAAAAGGGAADVTVGQGGKAGSTGTAVLATGVGCVSSSNSSGGGKKAQQLGAGRQAVADKMVVAGELLHILRPVAYALALRRWGRSSWRPWLLSLAIDLTSMQLAAAGARLSQGGPSWFGAVQPANLGPSLLLLRCLQQTRWAAEEERELAARRMRLLVYLLRDPLFGRYTQVALERWVSGTARMPLLGWASARAADILLGVQRYYTYIERMAAS